MLRYGPYLYSVLYLLSVMVDDMMISGLLFAIALFYLFINLIYEWDDIIIITPLFVFFCALSPAPFDKVAIIAVPILEFIFFWWFHILRKNNECNDGYLETCRKSVILSSALLLISLSKALEDMGYTILISSLCIVVAVCIFIYVHMDVCFSKSKKQYGLTKNDEQEELFGINDDMI